MAVTKKILSMDEYFRFTEGNKIIINHLSYMDSHDMEYITNKLTTVYSGDTIIAAPHCDCGATKGRYLLGTECSECSTLCTDPKERTKPALWFEALDNSLKFINPAFWNTLNALLPGRIDALRWLVDVRYNPKGIIPNYVLLARQNILNGERSYLELVNNMDALLDYFVNSTELKSKATYKEILVIRKIYHKYKDDIMSNYLPILNKKLFVVEKTTKGIYTNLVLGDVIDTITMWLKAAEDDSTYKAKITATGLLISKLSALYVKYYDKYLTKKPGIFRKHIYGARSHFTFRTVITASRGKHKHNEIIPPWLIALTTYRPHMLNKLIRRGYSYKQADKLLNRSIMAYDPVLEEIQQELIAECPYEQGLPIIVNRNQHMGFAL